MTDARSSRDPAAWRLRSRNGLTRRAVPVRAFLRNLASMLGGATSRPGSECMRASLRVVGGPAPAPGSWGPWIICRNYPEDWVYVFERLPRNGELTVEIETVSGVRHAGSLTIVDVGDRSLGSVRIAASGGGFVTLDSDEVCALRVRLGGELDTVAVVDTFRAFADRRPLVDVELATGQYQLCFIVGVESEHPYGDPEAWCHVLPVPVEVLSTEPVWQQVRQALYDSARCVAEEWKQGGGRDSVTEWYLLADVAAVEWVEVLDDVPYWVTPFVPLARRGLEW